MHEAKIPICAFIFKEKPISNNYYRDKKKANFDALAKHYSSTSIVSVNT